MSDEVKEYYTVTSFDVNHTVRIGKIIYELSVTAGISGTDHSCVAAMSNIHDVKYMITRSGYRGELEYYGQLTTYTTSLGYDLFEERT